MNRTIFGFARTVAATLRARGLLIAMLGWLALLAGPAFAQYAADGFDPDVDGKVRSVVVQADGRILIGGDFTQVDGQARNRLARLNADGSLDAAFNPSVTGDVSGAWVEAMAVQADGKILLGGMFTQVGGQPQPNLVRLNADGSLDAGFGSTANGLVSTLALQADGRILLGGYFTQVAGQVRNSLARLNADGSLDAGFNPGANSAVLGLAVQADGRILAGGGFTQIAGQPSQRLARLHADGRYDASFSVAGTTNNSVLSLAVQADGKVLVGGSFTQIVGQSRGGITRLNANGSFDAGFTGTVFGSVARLAMQADGRIVLGGNFVQVNGQSRTNAARLGADGSLDTGFNAGAFVGGDVLDVAVQADGKVLLGGAFTQIAGTTRNRVARLGANGALDTFFAAALGGGNLYGIAMQPDGRIVLGGLFSQVNGQPRSNLARLNADGTLDTGFNPGADLEVRALAVQGDGRILVGGFFNTVAGQPRNRIARLNADGSLDAGFDPNADGEVQSIDLQNGMIVVGGAFTQIAGQTRNRLARLDANGNLDASFNPDANLTVQTMTVLADGKILIGGLFTTVGGTAHWRLARLNANGNVDTTFNLHVNGIVQALALQASGKLLAGGGFSQFGQVDPTACARYARINTNGSLDTPCRPTLNNAVLTIAQRTNGKALIGGAFSQVDGVNQRIAQTNADGSLDTGFAVNANGAVTALTVQADGKVLVGGNFTSLGTGSYSGLARLSTPEAALQSLAVGADRASLIWLRSGAAPELSQVAFEMSSNEGATWTSLAAGQRIAGGWQANGLSLPRNARFLVRARGQARSGYLNSSGSLIESVRQVYLSTYAVTASVDSGQGGVTPASQTLEAGDAANFTITPAANWHVAAVSGDTCTPVDLGGGLWRATNIQAACAVKVSFAIDTHAVTPSAGTHGTISPDTAQSVNHGATTTFTVTPTAGYGATVGGSCGGSLSGTTYTTSAITADCTVQASFVQNAPAAVAVQGGGAQSALVGAAFGQALTVRVADAGNVPLQGVVVNFAAVPVGGASATLSATSATTDAAGFAKVDATANATGGSYTVNAGVSGVAVPATFALTNTRYDASVVLSSTPSSPVPGGTALLTATVSSTAPFAPGGSVSFKVDSTTTCANVPVSAGGVATCNAGPFSVGAHVVEALYGGDAKRNPASILLPLTVDPVATATTLSAAPAAVVYGQSVALSATVTPASVAGSVAFAEGATPLAGCAAVTVSGGQAACQTAALAVGTHALTATFVPSDGNSQTSVSAAASVTVAKAATSVSITPPAPITFGDSVAIGATVAVVAPGAASLSGQITIDDGSGATCTITLPATSCSLTPTSAGTKTLSASFVAAAAIAANVDGSSATTTLTVGRAAQAALSLTATPNPLIPGMTSQLAASGGSGSGAVTHAAEVGPCTVSGAVATATGPGLCIVRASKAGDANYEPASTTTPLTVMIAVAPQAQPQSVDAALNTPRTVQLVGSDGNTGGPYALTYAIAEAPAHGTIGQFNTATGSLTYTPAANYVGADRFTFTVASANGTSAPAEVSVATGAPQLALAIADGRSHVRYGQLADYVVTLTSAGSAANAVPVTFALSQGFDRDGLQIACVGATDGASCSQDAVDPLRFTVTLPPGRSLSWLVSVPVRNDAGDEVTFAASAIGAGTVSDINLLVLFRDGFEAGNGVGTLHRTAVDRAQSRAVLDGDVAGVAAPTTLSVAVPHRVAADAAPTALAVLRNGAREARIDAIAVAGTGKVGTATFVRLQARDADGRERGSAWIEVDPGAALLLGSVAANDGGRVLLLEGARRPLSVVLGTTHD